MNLRWTGGVIAGLAVVAAAVFFWWRAGNQREIVAASIPPQPDLGALPAEMRQRVAASEKRARRGPDRVAALGELSVLYHANGFFTQAGQCYQGLLQVDAANPRWAHRYATILAGYGQLEEALLLWRRAVELAPDFLLVRLKLGDALLKTNRNAEAAMVYDAVLKREPDNPYALLGLARIDMDAKRWQAARNRLEVVVAKTNYTIGYDLLPTVCEYLGDTRRAESIRGQRKDSGAFVDVPDPWIDELFDDCYDTYRLILAGGSADQSGDHRTAMRRLDRAAILKPGDVAIQFKLAAIDVELHDSTGARRHFERCVALAPDFPDGWIELVLLLKKMGDREASERALATGLVHCPRSPGLHLERGRQLSAAGRLTEAVGEFQESIRLRPNEAVAYIDLASAYFGLDRIDEALVELRQSLMVEPQNPMALSTLALHAIRTGDEPGATELLKRIRMQPRIFPEDLETLVRGYRERFGRSPW
jgi:tetratricopeptide (TPR) repeat protein